MRLGLRCQILAIQIGLMKSGKGRFSWCLTRESLGPLERFFENLRSYRIVVYAENNHFESWLLCATECSLAVLYRCQKDIQITAYLSVKTNSMVACVDDFADIVAHHCETPAPSTDIFVLQFLDHLQGVKEQKGTSEASWTEMIPYRHTHLRYKDRF